MRTTTGKAKVLTDAQQRAALAVLTEPRDRCMFLLSIKGALRAVESAGLRWSHIHVHELDLTSDITKGSHPRTVPLNAELKGALLAYKEAVGPSDDSEHLFPNRQLKGRHVSANAVSAWFRYVYRIKMGWQGCSSHSGRRTAITAMARKVSAAGGSLRDVQDIAGHARLDTTQRYIEVSSDARRRLVDMI